MKSSYYYLQNIKYKNNLFLIMFLGIFIIFIILSFFLESYSNFNTYGIYENGFIKVNILVENSDKITLNNKMKIKNDEYSYKIDNISDLLNENYQNYQIYTLKTNINLKENEVVKITFYFDKEKIIKKIFKIIF
ncbi:MAG: hypothetical protein ACI4XR_01235 [Bacilli bacterium]